MVLELVLACGWYKLCLLLTCLCAGMSIVPEICFLPPFLQGRWKCECSKTVCVVTVDYNSYAEQLWRNSKLFCSLKSSFETETASLFSCSPSLSIFLLCHCWLADKLSPSQEKCSSWGIIKLCGSVRNCQSHRIVPVFLGFCWSPKMLPLLLICCKIPPQHGRSPASIVSGFCTL